MPVSLSTKILYLNDLKESNFLISLFVLTIISRHRPYTETDQPSRIVSKYQLAARYGRQDSANCGAQYDGCVVNFLDALNGIFNFVF